MAKAGANTAAGKKGGVRGTAKVERLHQSIAREIGTEILNGRYPPGSQLGGEIEEALAKGVSRTPYREAIRILVAKGLVESKPRAGTRVTDSSRWNVLDPDILAWTFSGEADEAFIRELFELRAIIEPQAAALAARRRTEEDVARLTEALGEMAHYGLGDPRGQAADQRFHRVILEAAGNRPLASLAESVGAAVSWTTRFKQRHQALPRDPIVEHRAVHAAIVAQHEASARGVMQDLLRLALADMDQAFD